MKKAFLFILLVFFGSLQAHAQSYEVKIRLDVAQEKEIKKVLSQFSSSKEKETRSITILDTKDRVLVKNGIVLRVRADKEIYDTTIKIRNLTLDQVDSRLFEMFPKFKCEINITASTEVPSCAFRIDFNGLVPWRYGAAYLFTRPQHQFLETHSVFKLNRLALQASQPVIAKGTTYKMNSDFKVDAEKMTLDLWTLPNGTQFLEISTKLKEGSLAQARKLRNELLEFLTKKGIRFDLAPPSRLDELN